MHFDEHFWVGLSAILFIACIFNPLKKFLAKSLDDKIEKIKQEIQKSEELKQEADRLFKEYTEKQKEAHKLVEEITKDAEEKIRIIYRDQENYLKEAIADKTNLAMQRIDNYKANAMNNLRSQAIENAIAAVTNIIKENPADEFSLDLIKKLTNKIG